jgi:hypothetical protein
VVFIMCDEEACGEASCCCIVRGMGDEEEGGKGGVDGREGEGREGEEEGAVDEMSVAVRLLYRHNQTLTPASGHTHTFSFFRAFIGR